MADLPGSESTDVRLELVQRLQRSHLVVIDTLPGLKYEVMLNSATQHHPPLRRATYPEMHSIAFQTYLQFPAYLDKGKLAWVIEIDTSKF